MTQTDIETRRIDIEPRIGGPGTLVRIYVDGVEWAIATGSQEGRHGLKFHFTDAAGVPIRRDPPPRNEGGRQFPASSYYAITKNRKEIDDPLRRAVVEMIEAGHLRHPDVAREAAEAARRELDAANDQRAEEKRQLWEAQALKAIGEEIPKFCGAAHTIELRDRIIGAMKWAQSQ